ncbi:hypothetical protein NQD34_018508 [Periophthalmus magnuspinnatus]|nr:hypothetical protein NQD34_018508 [Periophthalmus magnuspinnatus]
MSCSKRERPLAMEDWTKDDVREWLVSDVKVSQTYAQRFFDEEVSGEYLVYFTKSEILDLDIKHGPAVKITNHVKQWKHQAKCEPQCPAYVQHWTKEQVQQWLLQHVKLYDKHASLLHEEVSGDCLVCFEKQDFKDLDIKQGPIVKILADLRQLKDKPEPELLPVVDASTEEEKNQPVQPVPSVSPPAPQPPLQAAPQKKSYVPNSSRRPSQQLAAPNIKSPAEVRRAGYGCVTG